MSDLRSQLIAKLGVDAPEPTSSPTKAGPDPLGPAAHLDSDWVKALLPAARGSGIKVNPNPSFGAVRQAHDVLVKHLKSNGRKREKAELDDLRSRYLKKREKLAWSRLKATMEEGGVSQKLYRAIKQSKVDPETALQRWARVSSRGLNQAEIRAALLAN
jgi:hypothetical protein